MQYRIHFRDGRVFVACSFGLSDEPKVRHLAWPTSIDERTAKAYDVRDGEPCERVDGGVYRLMEHRRPGGDYLTVRLRDGGETLAEHDVVVSAPSPKVRRGVEVRWYCGQWEKYLKTKGWVTA